MKESVRITDLKKRWCWWELTDSGDGAEMMSPQDQSQERIWTAAQPSLGVDDDISFQHWRQKETWPS